MKASEPVKKLGELFNGKVNTSAGAQGPGGVESGIQVAPAAKVPEIPLLDRLGEVQLHQYWRN
jgi:hypothetical protein